VNTANLPEWKGDNSGVLLPQNSIADSEESWHALWRQHMASDNAAVPEVDFARSIVVGVFAGQKPSAGYAVQIMEIKSIPNALVVNYTETTPPANAMSAAMITHPYHIKVIPKTNLIIQFKKN